ncbi:MAG: hypothetical protein JW932_19815 [Deltaproteobacteria bacterium]|nr:hypothetical protein [Deltaproteobacteria bacterium]
MKRFFIDLFLLSFFFVFCVSSSPANELKVVKTVPSNGSNNVDPFLSEVEIYFSGPIKMNSWSFVKTGRGEFPETMGDPFFPDNRTCILPVMLGPGKTYSIGINSETRKGFKSAADERIAATPYVLTFTTGQEEGKGVPEQTRQQNGNRPSASAVSNTGSLQAIFFRRVSEPREKAFSIVIPDGWQVEGGIFRVDPTAQGGPSQSIAAKLDFAVKKDPQGSVMVRWLPDVLFFDARMSPAGQMGLLPLGSNYQGMTVCPVMPAQQFISQIVFPYAHPQVGSPQPIGQQRLSSLAQKYQERVHAAMPNTTFSYDAAIMTFLYQEGGMTYQEKIFTIIENWGQLGAGMWGNKETFLIRAPKDAYDQWEPIFSLMQNSVMINQQWLMGEIRGQMERSRIVRDTQREIQRIDQEIVEHRQRTNAEIHNDMFLNLTDQEEYVNPYTNKVETGSNQWRNRWINESGDVIYTNDDNYDPRTDHRLNRSDFKRSPVKERFPQ